MPVAWAPVPWTTRPVYLVDDDQLLQLRLIFPAFAARRNDPRLHLVAGRPPNHVRLSSALRRRTSHRVQLPAEDVDYPSTAASPRLQCSSCPRRLLYGALGWPARHSLHAQSVWAVPKAGGTSVQVGVRPQAAAWWRRGQDRELFLSAVSSNGGCDQRTRVVRAARRGGRRTHAEHGGWSPASPTACSAGHPCLRSAHVRSSAQWMDSGDLAGLILKLHDLPRLHGFTRGRRRLGVGSDHARQPSRRDTLRSTMSSVVCTEFDAVLVQRLYPRRPLQHLPRRTGTRLLPTAAPTRSSAETERAKELQEHRRQGFDRARSRRTAQEAVTKASLRHSPSAPSVARPGPLGGENTEPRS